MITSSTTTSARAGSGRARALRAPERLAARARASRPAWSRTTKECLSSGATRTSRPPSRSERPAARASSPTASYPRARTAARRDGIGTSRTGASTSGRAAIEAARSPLSTGSNRWQPDSLNSAIACRSGPPYTPAATGGTGYGSRSAVGTGSGQLSRGDGCMVAAQTAHSSTPASAQPTQQVPRTRSAAARRRSPTGPRWGKVRAWCSVDRDSWGQRRSSGRCGRHVVDVVASAGIARRGQALAVGLLPPADGVLQPHAC